MSSAPQIVMIADDLSGAADCAVSCAVQGLRTVVQLSETPSSEPAQVLAIDAATRSMPADRAAATVARIVANYEHANYEHANYEHANYEHANYEHANYEHANYEHAPGRVLFKKLDSVLRGHIGPELAAMRRGPTPTVIVMAPALPAQGRTTIDGCQWLNGQRVAGAEAQKLLESAGLSSAQINLALVRGAPSQLAAAMTNFARHQDALVCDAETDGDLQAIAAAIAALPHAGWDGSIIWAGSSGLARHIPEAMGIAGASGPVDDPRFRGPILLVVGSRTAVAHQQGREAGHAARMTTVLLAPDKLREGCGTLLGDALDSGNDVMAMIDSSDEAAEDPRLCAALASWVLPHLDKVGALIATGGETARAVLAMSNITGLRLLREVETGVPLAVSTGAREMPVITKSGSFGSRATLAHCVQVLRGLKLE